jgi:putative nucleotidyltransferase with HDIG domain
MPDIQSTAKSITRRLRDAGYTALYAGGCVRDMLLGKTAKDYDIATNARPDEVQALFPNTYAVGAHFGVVVVHEHGEDFEVATFRSDGAYVDGRRPEGVVFSSPQLDAERRDFTINGLFFDPFEGKVIDYVNGQQDLQAKVLRAIGDPVARFREDKLRLLRAVRFSAGLGFELESATWAAVKQHAADIHNVSAERIREELVRIFTSPTRVRGFDLLVESGLVQQILPEIITLQGCEQPPQFHPEGDVFVHTRAMLGLLPEKVSIPLVFGVLFHDIGKPPTFAVDETGRIRFNGHDKLGAEMTQRIMERLKFSNADAEGIVSGVANHMVFKDVKTMRVSKLKRFMARPGFDDELELHRVDCTSASGMLDNYKFIRERQVEFANEPLIPPPLLTGHDLKTLGLTPGPKFREILETAANLQLEGTLASRDAALDWARSHIADNP